MLYTEDTYEIEGEPYFGYLRGRYSHDELKEIDCYAASKGIELIPCIQTLAHLNAIFRWTTYAEINDCNDILLLEDEKTYQLIDKMFETLSECFTSRIVNVGMDEAHMMGLGKYLDKHGYQNRHQIFLKHLDRVVEISTKYGFKPIMWSDMFYRMACKGEYYEKDAILDPEVIKLVPK
jgi:N-acetyl-beta-hexosaminidase